MLSQNYPVRASEPVHLLVRVHHFRLLLTPGYQLQNLPNQPMRCPAHESRPNHLGRGLAKTSKAILCHPQRLPVRRYLRKSSARLPSKRWVIVHQRSPMTGGLQVMYVASLVLELHHHVGVPHRLPLGLALETIV